MCNRPLRFPSLTVAAILSLGLAAIVRTGELPAAEEEPTLRHTAYQKAFFGDDHASEGFLAPLDDGNIMLIFRLDPGIGGNHVGTGGYIARMTYDPAQDRWGEVRTVYNSNRFDDRNIHGGITNEGRIVVFFRRYDPPRTEGRYFIYSDDKGRTWSDLQTSEALTGVPGTGQMFYNPEIEKHGIVQYRRHRNDILYSKDGSSWDESTLIAEDPDVHLTEIAGAWCGDGRMIALIRDDRRRHGHPLLQVTSRDHGATWQAPARTNIPPDGHWGCAPQLIYDAKRDLLIALTSDRYSKPHERNSLYVYTARPEEVVGNPQRWTLRSTLPRPWAMPDFDKDRPLNQNLYGYPTIAPINEDEYLVVFTERAVMHGTEQADLYYFRLIWEEE